MTGPSTNALKALITTLVGVVAMDSASGHHSFAIFDHTRTLELRGIVREFQWTNPHGYIQLDLSEDVDGVTGYTLELTSINMLRRAGWRSSDVQPGDVITVVAAPLLDGEPGGLLLELATADGRTLIPPVPDIESFRRTQ